MAALGTHAEIAVETGGLSVSGSVLYRVLLLPPHSCGPLSLRDLDDDWEWRDAQWNHHPG